jgi:hypothetical protein
VSGRHSPALPPPTSAASARARLIAVVLALVVVIGGGVAIVAHNHSAARHRVSGLPASARTATATSPARSPSTKPTGSPTPAPTPTRSPAHPTSTSAAAGTDSAITALIDQAPSGGASVSALNLATGKSVTLGASSGMLEASISKIALLEILLLEHEDEHTTLSSYEDSELHQMIENSSNDAANEVFVLAGGHDTVVAHQRALGLDTKITVYGQGNLWGLTTSDAAQQVVLLHNLVATDSPLDAKSQAYALELLENVESDQQWGVPSAAQAGTTFAVKNGWLAVDSDHDLWAVNSDGIITAHGQKLLVSVMTQHDTSFDGGIAYNEKLVHAVVAALT